MKVKSFFPQGGTESGTDMLIADVDLTINSLARSQAIDMINWWSRITTERGKPALQVEYKNRYVYDEHAGHDIFIGREFVLAPAVQGEGLISADDLARGLQVNGHSLGGQLASAFARIFGKQAILSTSAYSIAQDLRQTVMLFFSSFKDYCRKNMACHLSPMRNCKAIILRAMASTSRPIPFISTR